MIMKKNLSSMLILLLFAGTMSAQKSNDFGDSLKNVLPKTAQRKYQIIVKNERNVKKVQETNNQLMALQESSRNEAQKGLVGDL